MLVLSRKIGERIVIEPGIEISVVEIHGGRVRIGVEAPQDIHIHRAEVGERPGRMLSAAGKSDSI